MVHLPTYVAIPLITGVLFFIAVFDALAEIARSSLTVAALLAIGGIALYLALVYKTTIDDVSLVAAILTLVFAGVIAKWLSSEVAWSVALLRVLLVESVMGVLAAINVSLVWRRRARDRAIESARGSP